MICTFYSSQVGFDKILDILKTYLPKGKFSVFQEDEYQILEVESKNGFFASKEKLKIVYRERVDIDAPLGESEDCPLSGNVQGLYRFARSLPANNEKTKELFSLKIKETNSEFSIIQEKGITKNLLGIIFSLAKTFDAFLFAQPNTLIAKSEGQHFLNHELKLISDHTGNTEVESFGDEIEAKYEELQKAYKEKILDILTEDQRERKLKNEETLRQQGIKVNRYLPSVESEDNTVLRTPHEIKERVLTLAIMNAFVSDFIPSDKTIELLKKMSAWEYVTPKELDLLENPTDEKKLAETWKCEGIWTLLWALDIVDDLGDASQLCDLGNVPEGKYPFHDAETFMKENNQTKSKKDIIDMVDLYYRKNWACVDARIQRMEVEELNPGVVHERLYALNWLVKSMDENWDEVSCHS